MEVKDWFLLGASLLMGLLTAELISWAPSAAEHLRRLAVRVLPEHHRERADEEWRRALEDIPGPLARVMAAATWVVKAASSPASSVQDAAIRVADIAFAFLALVFLGPFLVALSFVIYLSNPGPVFFAQRRLGKGGRAFPAIKFRTMVVDAEQRLDDLLARDEHARAEWLLRHRLWNDPRITSFGAFLRRSHLDELPQLVNVLRGEMSLVGPRPLIEAEAVRYGCNFQDYGLVRPGITGLWQVSGRSDHSYDSYDNRIELDVEYARSRSVGLYFLVLLMTLPAVLHAKGSY